MFDDFTHHAYQLAFFTDSGSIAADEFSVACRKQLDIGPFTPQFLPAFPGMPDEFPRLQIQSETGYSVSLTGSRVDLIIDKAYGLTEDHKAVFLKNAKSLVALIEGCGATFLRVGLVRRYFKVMERPGRFVSNAFGGKGGEGLVDFSVNGVVRVEFQSRKCNSVYNISSGIIRGSETGVVAFRDINIVPGENALSSGAARSFIDFAESALGLDSMSEFVKG